MKNFACLFVLMLFFTGCSTEDDANVPDGLLKRVHVTPFAADEEYTARYYYDGYKLDRIESSNGKREIYYYDGDLIVNIKDYEDTDLVMEKQFQYDNSGRLEQYHEFNYADGTQWIKAYTYNADQTVTLHRNWISADGIDYPQDNVTQYFFADGEVSKIVNTSPSGIGTVTFTYDDKLVPEHGITGLDKIRMFDPVRYKGVFHNIVTVTQTDSNNPEVGTYSHLWQYNDDGAPTYFSFDDGGTITIDGGTIEYFYK